MSIEKTKYFSREGSGISNKKKGSNLCCAKNESTVYSRQLESPRDQVKGSKDFYEKIKVRGSLKTLLLQ